jgi:hypothetical protein
VDFRGLREFFLIEIPWGRSSPYRLSFLFKQEYLLHSVNIGSLCFAHIPLDPVIYVYII